MGALKDVEAQAPEPQRQLHREAEAEALLKSAQALWGRSPACWSLPPQAAGGLLSAMLRPRS